MGIKKSFFSRERVEWMAERQLDDWKQQRCILEVDLEYPEHLHDLHNYYLLAPKCIKIGKVEN